jgi:hypothetical protein
MANLFSGLEMIGAFLLTPVILTLLIFYCERRFVREPEFDSHPGRAAGNVEMI